MKRCSTSFSVASRTRLSSSFVSSRNSSGPAVAGRASPGGSRPASSSGPVARRQARSIAARRRTRRCVRGTPGTRPRTPPRRVVEAPRARRSRRGLERSRSWRSGVLGKVRRGDELAGLDRLAHQAAAELQPVARDAAAIEAHLALLHVPIAFAHDDETPFGADRREDPLQQDLGRLSLVFLQQELRDLVERPVQPHGLASGNRRVCPAPRNNQELSRLQPPSPRHFETARCSGLRQKSGSRRPDRIRLARARLLGFVRPLRP